MTILLTNGCSFTWGHGLDTQDERDITTWPYFLGKKINASKTVNLSYGNGSNNRIFRTTLNWLSKQSQEDLDNTIAIIQFSEAARNEFYYPMDEHDPTENFKDHWIRYKPGLMNGDDTLKIDFMNSPYYAPSQQGYSLWSTQLASTLLASNVFSMIGLFQTYGIKKYWFWPHNHDGDKLSAEFIEVFKKTPWIYDSYMDPFKYEQRRDNPARWKTTDDQHPSPVGHEQIAQQIYDYIKDKLP